MLKTIDLSSDHPLTRAVWIWPGGELYLNNCLAQFRYDFELKSIPEKAPFFITADQSYRLYLNGRYVCRGPARGYQSHWPYDEIDLAGLLQNGHNWFSIEAYNPGCGSFKYIHAGVAGMICAAEWGEVKIRSCKEEWLLRRAPGHKSWTSRLSTQMEFQEEFDAAEDDGSWITSPVPPKWTEHPMYLWSGRYAFGCGPWRKLEERAIPMLRETLIVPEITAQATGPMTPGCRDCFNIAWQWAKEEFYAIRQWLPGSTVPAEKTPESLQFTMDPAAPQEFRAITLSLGRICAGCLILDVDHGAGGEIIDCYIHQSVRNGRPDWVLPVGNGGQLAQANRMRCARGHSYRMFYLPLGTRDFSLIFRDLKQPLKIKAAWRTAEYPFTMKGRFQTSDTELNEIVRICRDTQQACAMDAYVDTPWREQGQWWGDARVQGKNTVYLDGDMRLLARGIRSVAGQTDAEGLVPGCAPCLVDMVLPDFSLTWIITVYDHYFQTGSLEIFREQRSHVEGVLGYFRRQMKDGLLPYDRRYWLFEDWSTLPKRDFPAFLNLWHLYALGFYEKLCAASGEDTAELRREIAERGKFLTEHFFDPEQQLFIAGRTFDGKELEQPSLHDQVIAILCGLVPEAWPAMLEKRLLPFLRDEHCGFAVPTSFWCNYLFDAAQLLGKRKEVLDFIRRHWAPMIPDGGTWEHLIFNRDDGQSSSHAWSAHPASHIPELLLGIRQLEPRWKCMAAAPDCTLLPASGEILLPLPPGDAVFRWENGKGTVSAPETIEIELEGSAFRRI